MPYRDNLVGLRSRLAELRAEEEQLDEKKAELTRATARLEEVRTELEEVSTRFEQARRLPLLEGLKIAAPCSASWTEMQGDDRVRHCDQCDKNVYNVAELTREEAEELVMGQEGVCLRMFRRADGRVITADCPIGAKKRRRRRWIAGAAAGAATAAGVTQLMVLTEKMGYTPSLNGTAWETTGETEERVVETMGGPIPFDACEDESCDNPPPTSSSSPEP